ncbi:MAG: hypothetical protein IPP33_06320 [Flavobacteriales bacterium]|nr:hypothetical protein [Flavobacteriales bacterium]
MFTHSCVPLALVFKKAAPPLPRGEAADDRGVVAAHFHPVGGDGIAVLPDQRAAGPDLADHAPLPTLIVAVHQVGVACRITGEVAHGEAVRGVVPDRGAVPGELRVAVHAPRYASVRDDERAVRRELDVDGSADPDIQPVPDGGAIGRHLLHLGDGRAQPEHIDVPGLIDNAFARARAIEAALIDHAPEQLTRRTELLHEAARVHGVREPAGYCTGHDGIALLIRGHPGRSVRERRARLVVGCVPQQRAGGGALREGDVAPQVAVVVHGEHVVLLVQGNGQPHLEHVPIHGDLGLEVDADKGGNAQCS